MFQPNLGIPKASEYLASMKTRKVYPGEVHHVCQQTVDGVLVFYSVSDYLVFFTIYCTVARRLGVKVLALCPMVDHTHNVVIVRNVIPFCATVHTFVFTGMECITGEKRSFVQTSLHEFRQAGE